MKIIKSTFVCFLVLSATRVSAVTIQPPITGGLKELIERIWHYIYWISFPIATLVIIWAGLMLITSSGNEKQIKHAKDLIMYVLIGFLTIILAQGVVNLIETNIAPQN